VEFDHSPGQRFCLTEEGQLPEQLEPEQLVCPTEPKLAAGHDPTFYSLHAAALDVTNGCITSLANQRRIQARQDSGKWGGSRL
jgi:hypothetical protein